MSVIELATRKKIGLNTVFYQDEIAIGIESDNKFLSLYGNGSKPQVCETEYELYALYYMLCRKMKARSETEGTYSTAVETMYCLRYIPVGMRVKHKIRGKFVKEEERYYSFYGEIRKGHKTFKECKDQVKGILFDQIIKLCLLAFWLYIFASLLW